MNANKNQASFDEERCKLVVYHYMKTWDGCPKALNLKNYNNYAHTRLINVRAKEFPDAWCQTLYGLIP